MREIIFRGKRVDTGEWIYGYYAIFKDKPYIGNNGVRKIVVPESVGQYSGFKNKDTKGIFEGDICQQGSIIAEVKFRYGCFFLCNPDDDGTMMSKNATDFHNLANQYRLKKERPFCKLETIGNTYSNPELLKKAS